METKIYKRQTGYEGPQTPVSGDRLPDATFRFLQLLISLTIACLGIEAFCRWVLHLGYPYNWPLMFPHPSFFDFEAYFNQFTRLHTERFFEGPYLMMYPSPVVVCYWFFYGFQPFATTVFVGLVLTTSLLAAVLAIRILIRRGMAARRAVGLVTATYLMSYPLWFEVKQGNMEVIVWIVAALGIACFMLKRGWTAAALFGVAGALKFYPIIYLGLLLARKRYRECIFGCAVAGITLLLSLFFVGPTIHGAWRGMGAGLALSKSDYLLARRPNEMGFDHSLFGLEKALVAAVHHTAFAQHVTQHFRPALLSSYMLTVALLGIALFFFRIRTLPVTN